MISCKQFALVFLLAFCLGALISCTCGDDDSFGNAPEDDDVDVDADDDADDDTADDDANDDAGDDDEEADCVTSPFSCKGKQINNQSVAYDNDGDNYSENEGDCNDNDEMVNPDVEEIFDGLDNNCDGVIDEGFDNDCDGYQSVESGGSDCNDNDYYTHQCAPELPDDGIDQNCNGVDLIPGDDTGVFVATTGDDGNIGTMATPKRTIKDAIRIAEIEDKVVFVAQGDYEEDVQTQISLYGGYEAANWTRDINNFDTTISAQTFAAVTVGVEPDDDRKNDVNDDGNEETAEEFISVAIQGFHIIGGSQVTQNDEDCKSYGVLNWGNLTVTDSVISGEAEQESNCRNNYGIYNGGNLVLKDDDIKGGIGREYIWGIYNNGVLMAAGNTIEKGISEISDYCVTNIGQARLVNNMINGDIENYRDDIELENNEINGSISSWEMSESVLINNSIHGGVSNSGRMILRENFVYGVWNDGYMECTYNQINLGNATRSFDHYGVLNSGYMFFSNNSVDGGIGGENSYGIYNIWNYRTCGAVLSDNTINGGSGSESSTGVFSYGCAIGLANNVVDGGSGGEVSVGIWNEGGMEIANNVINGGSGGSESYAIVNKEYSYFFSAPRTSQGDQNDQGNTALSDPWESTLSAVIVNNILEGGSGDISQIIKVVILFGEYVGMEFLNNDIYGSDADCMIFGEWAFSGDTECLAHSISEINSCSWFSCMESSDNINSDPLFVNPVGGDYHLQGNSPCIDEGVNPWDYISDPVDFSDYTDLKPLINFDFDGEPRPYGAGWDIGPDEWKPGQ